MAKPECEISQMIDSDAWLLLENCVLTPIFQPRFALSPPNSVSRSHRKRKRNPVKHDVCYKILKKSDSFDQLRFFFYQLILYLHYCSTIMLNNCILRLTFFFFFLKNWRSFIWFWNSRVINAWLCCFFILLLILNFKWNRLNAFEISKFQLSDDAWLHVFKFLDVTDRFNCERVSRRFNRLAKKSWKSLHQINTDRYFEELEPHQMAPCLSAILSMFQKNFFDLTNVQ